MTVTIESAGSHAFDLGHIRREGGEPLIESLLTKAGLDTHLTWRVQVQKKLTCNSETPPLRVVYSPKKWAVYLKIKPGDNNSCHFCTLLMPGGLQGLDVYQTLKRVEQELDRNWKHHSFKRVPMTQLISAPSNGDSRPDTAASVVPPLPPAPAPVVPAAAVQPPTDDVAPTPRFSTKEMEAPAAKKSSAPKGWLGDPEKVRLILLAIHEINADGFVADQEHFVRMLCRKLGWDTANRYEVGGIFTGLGRKDYVMRLLRGTKAIGYELTREGRTLIQDLIGAPPAPAPAPAIDRAQLICSFGRIAQRFAAAQDRLDQMTAREKELVTELADLRREREDICKLLEEQQVQELIDRLHSSKGRK